LPAPLQPSSEEVLVFLEEESITSGASGLAPDARIEAGLYFFFFFAAFFVAKTLTSLRNQTMS
jgi:hypothetical protein